jgi:hypothetical protein
MRRFPAAHLDSRVKVLGRLVQGPFYGGDVHRVVDVSGISRAAALDNETGISELAKVIGDQVLLLTDELDQFADSMVAVGEVANQAPPQIVSEHLEWVIDSELGDTLHASGLYQSGLDDLQQ